MKSNRISMFFTVSVLGLSFAAQSQAAIVPLQNATATYSQGSEWTASNTIDGITVGPLTSWAIFPNQASPQTIVWETQSDQTFDHTPVNFLLYHHDTAAAPAHSLGHFRLSYTTDNRDLFADGLANGGDVTANWIPINPTLMSSTEGETFTGLPDFSIMVSGGANQFPTYTIGSLLTASGVTGFRLEAIPDPSLPHGGSGRQPANGNFTLSEFVVSAVPEPETYAMLLAGLGLLGFMARRRKESIV
ncbi:FxDxF family PEP-CTERM protein [Nitrosomonas sp.]|uniref:FxDxF family PEP-CTERM protein n=1 Tax=Nitrosomonas sp. TaxID=42353 RepID=UPI0025EA4E3A|nr:FxDxF family PEP-CTERM protein [Nitrosomonas sp.]